MSLIDRIESLERLYEKVRVERDALAAHAEAFQARAIALAADRDQISLTLAVAKADRDKWFNRARDLEAAFRHVISIVDDVVMHDHEKVRQLQRHCSAPETPVSTLCPVCDQIKELHPNTHPWVPKTIAETPAQRQCECLTYCVEKCKLAPDQYCRKDREAAGLAQETRPDPCPICTAPAGTHFINCERWEVLGTTAETLVKPEFDPAWVCSVCGKRHGPDQCLGAETGAERCKHGNDEDCPECAKIRADRSQAKAETAVKPTVIERLLETPDPDDVPETACDHDWTYTENKDVGWCTKCRVERTDEHAAAELAEYSQAKTGAKDEA